MLHGRADEIEELFLNELLAILNRIEDFPDGQRGSGVLANQPKTFLQFRRCWVLKPEGPVWLKIFAQSRGFNRSQPVVGIVQNVNLRTELLAQSCEQLWNKTQI